MMRCSYGGESMNPSPIHVYIAMQCALCSEAFSMITLQWWSKESCLQNIGLCYVTLIGQKVLSMDNNKKGGRGEREKRETD